MIYVLYFQDIHLLGYGPWKRDFCSILQQYNVWHYKYGNSNSLHITKKKHPDIDNIKLHSKDTIIHLLNWLSSGDTFDHWSLLLCKIDDKTLIKQSWVWVSYVCVFSRNIWYIHFSSDCKRCPILNVDY